LAIRSITKGKSMKHPLLAVAFGLTLTVSGAARADGDDDAKECSNASLRGLYLFNASGYNIVSGVAQPKAVVEYIHFNGDGTLTAPAATTSINGTILHSANTPGTYQVFAGCTGTLQFGPPGPAFDLFVPAKGQFVVMIQTANPPAIQGAPVLQG